MAVDIEGLSPGEAAENVKGALDSLSVRNVVQPDQQHVQAHAAGLHLAIHDEAAVNAPYPKNQNRRGVRSQTRRCSQSMERWRRAHFNPRRPSTGRRGALGVPTAYTTIP